MEKAIDALSSKLTGDFQSFLDEYGISAPSSVTLGDVDLSRNRQAVTAFILPEDEDFSEETIGTDLITQKPVIYLFMRGKSKDDLTADCLRAVRAFRTMLLSDVTLGGEVGYSHLERASYLHGVEGNDGIKGIELTVRVETEE